MPVLTFCTGNLAYGALERKKSVTRILSMSRFYGPASTFLTLAPDDINNPTAFRATFRNTNNVDFPSLAPDTFFDSLRENSSFLGNGTIPIPCSYADRARAMANNPVTAAWEYRRLIKAVLQILIGIDVEVQGCKAKKTILFSARKKGIFGHCIAAYGVNEAQGRGTLHFHVILWGSLTPKLLEASLTCEDFCQKMGEVLDSMYRAEADIGIHVESILRKCMKSGGCKLNLGEPPPAALQVCPLPLAHPEEFDVFSQNVAVSRNDHTDHSFTCHKPPTGNDGCRLDMPRGECDSTFPVYLTKNLSDPTNGIPVVTSPIPPAREIQKRNIQEEPVPLPDDRTIVWELQRRCQQSLPPVDTSELSEQFFLH